MKKTLLLFVLASLLFSACSAGERSLVGTWNLTAYGPEGSTIPAAADSQANVTFNEDGTLTGHSGCNGFGGEYKVDGDQITFSGLISTLVACGEPLVTQESTLYRVLSGTATYEIDGDTLTLNQDGTVLVFTAAGPQSYPYP